MNSEVPLSNDRSNGFLSGFVEESTEKPVDELNGDCIIHYGGEYSGYTMRVKLVDGVREGEAVIEKSGVPYMKLEYDRGSLFGFARRLNMDGVVVMKGLLINGVERGLFQEYNTHGRVIWREYYRDGEKYSEVVESNEMKGCYVERRVGDETLLSIAQYDNSLHDKDGHCLEYVNGELTGEWIYQNGVRVNRCNDSQRIMDSCCNITEVEPSVHSPIDNTPTDEVPLDSPNDEITPVDESEVKTEPSINISQCNEREEVIGMNSDRPYQFLTTIVDRSVLIASKEKPVIEYNMVTGFSKGVWKANEMCIEFQWSLNENHVIVGNLNRKEMVVYENNVVVLDAKERGGIDLDVNGRRWEGGVRDGKPCGYGVVYDEEGRNAFVGFMMDVMELSLLMTKGWCNAKVVISMASDLATISSMIEMDRSLVMGCGIMISPIHPLLVVLLSVALLNRYLFRLIHSMKSVHLSYQYGCIH